MKRKAEHQQEEKNEREVNEGRDGGVVKGEREDGSGRSGRNAVGSVVGVGGCCR